VTNVTSGGPLGRILRNSSGHVTGHETRHFWSRYMLMKLDDSFQGYIFYLFCIQERQGQFSSLMEQYQLTDFPQRVLGPLGRILRNSSGHVTGHETRHFWSRDFLSRDFRLLYLAPHLQIWLELSPYTTEGVEGCAHAQPEVAQNLP
jgi:hypothetical protein